MATVWVGSDGGSQGGGGAIEAAATSGVDAATAEVNANGLADDVNKNTRRRMAARCDIAALLCFQFLSTMFAPARRLFRVGWLSRGPAHLVMWICHDEERWCDSGRMRLLDREGPAVVTDVRWLWTCPSIVSRGTTGTKGPCRWRRAFAPVPVLLRRPGSRSRDASTLDPRLCVLRFPVVCLFRNGVLNC